MCQQGLIICQIFFRVDANEPVFNAECGAVLDEFDIQSQLFEHGEERAGIFGGADATIVSKTIPFK